MSNKYTRVLGYAALICLAFGLFGWIMQATAKPPASLTVPPVLIVGVVVGVLWLVVKAVLHERKP